MIRKRLCKTLERYHQEVCKEEKGGVPSRGTDEPTGLSPGQREEDTAMEQQTTAPTVASSPT